jgi:hypothetical protein
MPVSAKPSPTDSQTHIRTVTERVTEFLAAESKVDRDACVIRGVKLIGLESRNGRIYTPEALSAAVAGQRWAGPTLLAGKPDCPDLARATRQ